MVARTGIGFSINAALVRPDYLDYASAQYLESHVDIIPALKCSLYFGMKEYSSGVSSAKDLEILINEIEKTDLSGIYFMEIHRFYKELNTLQHFKGIMSMQNKYQKKY